MRFPQKKLLAALISASLAGAVQAADNPQAVSVLMDQARYWKDKGRGDLAAEAWQKVLLVEPNNGDALFGLGLLEAESGRTDSAQSYLNRLQKTNPGHPGVLRLSQSLQFLTVDKVALERARKLAQSGNYEESATVYRGLFGAQGPTVGFAPEYYQTLGGTQKGWDEARKSLDQLSRENPESTSLALSAAQVQTYREESRRQGIRTLAQLSKRSEVAAPAIDAWGKALTWLDARPADAPLYREYLEARPNDTAVRQKLADIGKPGVAGAPANPAQVRRDRMIAQGFTALDRGQLDVAEANFTRILTERPNDADASGGLGVVRFRQQRFKESEQLLERAIRPRSKKWHDALAASTYWALIEDANTARNARDNNTAKAALTKAREIDATEPVGATVLADILVEEGNFAGGEKLYRDALARQPDNRSALRGLYSALAGQKRMDDAQAVLKQLPSEEVAKLGDLNAARVTTLRGQARQAAVRGDLAGARGLLEQAIAIDTGEPWARLELARLDIAQSRLQEARGAAQVMRSPPQQNPASYYAAAILFSELGEPQEGLVTLENVPPAARTPEMYAFQRRLWVSAQSDQLTRLTQAGRRADAYALAASIENQAGGDPDLQLAIAYAYSEAGDSARALTLARNAIGRIAPSNVDARLQYAGILQRTRQDAEFASVLQGILQQPLAPRQRRNANDLRAGYVLTQAYALRDAGRIDEARNLLQPMINERPDDTRFQLALARTYDSTGDREGAMAQYQRVLDRDPRNLDARIAAINSAIVLKDFNYARSGLDQALAQAPRNPQVLAAAGRLARAEGDLGQAAKYFKEAIEVDRGTGFEMRGSRPADEFSAAPVPAPRRYVSNARDIGDGGAGEIVPLASKLIVSQAPAVQPWTTSAPPPVAPQGPWAPVPGAPAPVQAAPAYIPPPVYQPAQPIAIPAAPVAAPAGAPVYNIYIVAPGSTPGQATQITLPGGPAITIGPAGVSLPVAPAAVAQPQVAPRPRPRVATNVSPNLPPAQPAAVAQPTQVAPAPAQRTAVRPQARPAPVARSVAPRSTAAAQPVAPVQAVPMQAAPVAAVPVQAAPVVAAQPIAPVQGGVDIQAPATPPERIEYTPTPPAPLVPIAAPRAEPPPFVPTAAPRSEPPPAPFVPIATTPAPRLDPPPARAQLTQFAPLPALPQSESVSVRRELAEIEARRGSSVQGEANVRSRRGEDGLSQLLEIEAPIEARIALDYDQHIFVRGAGVSVDAGSVNASDRGTQSRFGTNALGPAGVATQSQSDSGFAASVGYESQLLRADIGTSPIGFRVRNTIGGIRFQGPKDGTVRGFGELSRRSVTDSLLSYAGARDERTGREWGGVVSTGGRAGVLLDDGKVGGYLQGSVHKLTGENVEDNTRVGAGGGIFVRLLNAPENTVSVGGDLTWFRFSKNLRHFTLGHGGYFSPQQYVALTIPVDWVGRSGRVSYQVRASAGVQRFREKEVDYFPTDGGLQGQLATAAALDPALRATYAGQTKSGGIYNLLGSLEYQAAPQFFVGGLAGVSNARDYQESLAGVYLRYAFARDTARLFVPPSPLRFNYSQY